ncbi:MAG: ArsR family transcriptional regulator [Chloroflexi bacterium]|nr:ArsR family transcriptional regulator [Chloroflexota bacterium]
MPGTRRWDQRFFASTRGRIVTLLRRASLTVDELADALDLTDNAVRAHLATLERDGLVQQRGVRRGGGKPAYAYALAPEADALFPRAYAAILRHALGQVAARYGRAEVEAVLRAVGRDLAASLGGQRPGATPEERLEGVQQVLAELGGLAEVRREEGRLVLQGYSCPLGAIVPDHPEACQLALALIQSLLGSDAVRERCVHGPEPRCAFEVLSAES